MVSQAYDVEVAAAAVRRADARQPETAISELAGILVKWVCETSENLNRHDALALGHQIQACLVRHFFWPCGWIRNCRAWYSFAVRIRYSRC
jgi:hypothetical protein